MDFSPKFIKFGDKRSSIENHVPAPYFRRSFVIDKEPESATLFITGLGYYEAFINGTNITKGFLAPYRSNLDHYIYYDKYDIADKLTVGKNTIGVILGNGIRNAVGAFVWDFDKAKFSGAPITAFSLEICFKNGDKQTVSSDTDTLAHSSPILFDDLHLGEYYDARLEIENWNMPDFDDSDWQNATEAEAPRGEVKLCEAEPIKIRNRLKAVGVTKYEDSYIYDFGVNSAGLCRLKIRGTAGQRVLMRFFEVMSDGKPNLKNFRFNNDARSQEDEYYLKGTGEETYTPHFTYHGFRYVLVSGITAKQATGDLLEYLEISSDIPKMGEFKCSDEVVNKIEEATVRSDISNFHYFPTDCPQREKNGWTADASLSAEQLLLNFAPENSYAEWMRNIYKALKDNGQLPGIVPTGGWGYHWGNGPAWDNVIINLPYYTYIYRGNTDILNELSAPLIRYLNYLYSRIDSRGLIEIGLGDWCQVGRNEGDFDTPLAVTDTILAHDIAVKAAFVYGVLKREPQKQFALSLADKLRFSFREKLIDKDTCTVFGNTQTAQAMALYYGMFEEDEKKAAYSVLLRLIDETDGHFNTGVLGGRIIYRLLADNGDAELAYNMLVRPDYPSYGNWIKRGATTLWEGFFPEGGRILSCNHHFWGDVSAWFYIYLAGIRFNPTGTDVKNVDIKPIFIERLNNVSAYHVTPSGKLEVNWQRTDDGVILTLSLPRELHGTVAAPDGYTFGDGETLKELSEGEFLFVKKQ